jgi:hypothetical protein
MRVFGAVDLDAERARELVVGAVDLRLAGVNAAPQPPAVPLEDVEHVAARPVAGGRELVVELCP